MEAVIDVVKRLRVQIRNANKLIQNEKLHDTYEATREIISEIRNSGGKAGGLGEKIDNYMDLHLNARSWFKKVSGYREDGALMAIHDQLDAGQMRMMYIQREINQMFSPVLDGKENQAEIKKLTSDKESDLVDIGIVDHQGNPVKVTREMRLSLIMHNMNKGNMQHVLGRGITIPDLKLYNKGKIAEAYARGKTYRYTKYETAVHAAKTGNFAELEMERSRAIKTIEQLEQDLSPYEKKFLSIAKEFFHKYSGDVVNEVSQELRGYAVARVNNYFPISTDQNFTRKEFSGLIKDGTIEGQGFLKERVNANNPIYLEGITNVVMRQTDSISRYAGLAIPVRNWQMLANTSIKDRNGMDDSISNAIQKTWGNNNLKWVENLLKDIQGGRQKENSIFDALRSKFAGATLELNPSVAIKQAASYPTAAAVLGAKPLLKAMKDLGKGFRRIGIEELEKINPLLWYRNQGNATQELGDIKSKKGFGGSLPRMLNWISNIDAATVRTLEYASAYYVDYNYKNLEKGSREYWEQVSKVFTQVVQQTQPNYTPMQQADIIRNPNRFLKQLFMFKTQPMQNFNILYDAIGEYKAAIRNKDKEWRKRAGRQVARAFSSQITSQLVFNLMTVAANLVLHKWYKYKDEAGEWSWEKFLESMGFGMIDAFSGILVGGSELETILSSVLAGQTYYDISVPSLDTMNSLVESFNYLKSASDSESRTKQILKISTTIGEIFGVPVGNIENIINSMVLYTTDIIEGEGIGNSENILSGTKFKSGDMYNAMYEAVQDGDMDRYDKILDNYIEKVATVDDPEEAAGKAVVQRIGDDYMSEEITEEEARKMLTTMEYGDEDIDDKIKGWNYKAETGQTYSKYARLKDYTAELIENPDDMETTQKAQDEVKNLIKEAKDKAKTSEEKTKAAGKVKSGIGSSLTNTYKDKFLDLKEQKKLGEATNMQAALIKIFMAAGYSHSDALKKIQDWKRE